MFGHEGAGVVRAVGEDVTHVSPGDNVVLSFDYDGTCTNCNHGNVAYCERFFEHNFETSRPADGFRPFSKDGARVDGTFFGQSSFATHTVAAEHSVVPVSDDVPLERLGPLGCGVQTGVGGVTNALDPEVGASIAIFGAGSVD